MTVGERLKQLRKEIGISQEAMGAQGFVSAPGWIKVENGQRCPSDELIHCVVAWLLRDSYITVGTAASLLEELLTLKYLASPSRFVWRLAFAHAKRVVFADSAILVSEDSFPYRTKGNRRKRVQSRAKERAAE